VKRDAEDVKVDWFSVDKVGLSKLVKRQGMAFVIRELWSNACDQKVAHIDMTLTEEGRGKYKLRVVDDDPEGFKNLSHAWTLFAESDKKAEATLRGRFNLGEKLVLAVCEWAEIVTTKGGVTFNDTGRHNKRTRRERGSSFEGVLRMTRDDVDAIEAQVKRFIVPDGVDAVWNGVPMSHRQPLTTFKVTLPTEIGGADGVLHRSERATMVRVFKPVADMRAALCELGVPVVEIDDKWDIDISQKIPLTLDRENVPPAYLAQVRAHVLNAMQDEITADDCSEQWVREATSRPECSVDAMGRVLDLRFGTKRVAFDPTDLEANKRAVSEGFTVVSGRSLNAQEWDTARNGALLLPAGRVTPTPKPFSADGKPLKYADESKLTEGQKYAVHYARDFALHALGHCISVRLAHDAGWNFDAAYGEQSLTINFIRYGLAMACRPGDEPWERFDALLIHELAHDKVSDHLSETYYDECCRIGARLRTFKAPTYASV
jgi:hypothetical protein